MEYPIIDSLTNAYIRNGWTGLEIIESKNIAPEFIFNGSIFGVQLESNQYVINLNGTASSSGGRNNRLTNTFILSPGDYSLSRYNETGGRVTVFLQNVNNTIVAQFSGNTITINQDTPCYIGLNIFEEDSYSGPVYIQIEKGTTVTPYEPPAPPTTDIKNRLKLPMIHYFPHPVIDSLKRASDGTMTADDVQVLRHYLTKFGIGNIELGRFHAINPNVSNDIKEIDLEPIPIDEPIKKKKAGEEDLNVKTE